MVFVAIQFRATALLVIHRQKSIKNIDGVDVNFISIDDLIKAKKVAGRLKDLADVETLEKIRSKT